MSWLDENKELLTKCVTDWNSKMPTYDKIYDYTVTGDFYKWINYAHNSYRTNRKYKANYIKKFIHEEESYLLSNDITYVSKSADKDIIQFIEDKTAHLSSNVDKESCKMLDGTGCVYELYYTEVEDENIRFKVKQMTRREAYLLKDENDKKIVFIRKYKKNFDNNTYYDIYRPDYIFHTNSSFIEIEPPTSNIWGEIPVADCHFKNYEYDTLYNELNEIQDDYNINMSDAVNEISDYRMAYLIMKGCEITEEDANMMKRKGIIVAPNENSDISFLTKNINDSFVKDTVASVKKDLYEISNHIDTNEKLQSNTSGEALKNRLIGLQQRVRALEGHLSDLIKTRLKFLFKLYKILEGVEYDYNDIELKFTLNIPRDDLSVAQTLTQLGIKENISLKTALSNLSFINNPDREIELIKQEQETEKDNMFSEEDYMHGGTDNTVTTAEIGADMSDTE